MDTQVTLSILALLSSFGTVAFFVIKWILTRKTAESDYERRERWGKQDYFKLLDERAAEVEEARTELNKLMVRIEALQTTIDELKDQAIKYRDEIRELRHELRNWKQGEPKRKEVVKQEVKDEITNGHSS